MKKAPLFVVIVLAATAAMASGKDSGAGIGVCLPDGVIEEVNEPSYYVQYRTVFAKKIFGGRMGTYYADTTGHGPVDGGRAYGFDVEGLARFGSPTTYGYAFAGAGYGRTTFSRPGTTPGTYARSSQWDWSMQGGVGVVFRKLVYLEAMYVQFQTDPKTSFIPVVIGFHF